ncbi:MAG: hypothetical protein CVV45_12785 [Spirochaetae bacterium HGW-Spirochaetae-10]|jgi:hypothetical protein|nr:MAG: hypothetical protein CVV45_12785 [Spirochaetae bacterium HGW-Spirochaetae-10]
MADLAANRGVDAIQGDFYLEKNGFDLAEDSQRGQNILDELIELFDMVPADDIDFPLLYSNQMRGQNSDERSSGLDRVRDAQRMIALIPGIDADASRVFIDRSDRIVLDLRLTDGTTLNRAMG